MSVFRRRVLFVGMCCSVPTASGVDFRPVAGCVRAIFRDLVRRQCDPSRGDRDGPVAYPFVFWVRNRSCRQFGYGTGTGQSSAATESVQVIRPPMEGEIGVLAVM